MPAPSCGSTATACSDVAENSTPRSTGSRRSASGTSTRRDESPQARQGRPEPLSSRPPMASCRQGLMTTWRGLGAARVAVGLAAGTAAAKDTLVLGMVLEPPHLDPTAGAAAAIDEVVYANVFEGLTRIDERGEVKPALAGSWSVS